MIVSVQIGGAPGFFQFDQELRSAKSLGLRRNFAIPDYLFNLFDNDDQGPLTIQSGLTWSSAITILANPYWLTKPMQGGYSI